jgi:hypothetical protein
MLEHRGGTNRGRRVEISVPVEAPAREHGRLTGLRRVLDVHLDFPFGGADLRGLFFSERRMN